MMKRRQRTLWDIWADSPDGSITIRVSSPKLKKQPPNEKWRPRLSTTALHETLSSYTPQHESEHTTCHKWRCVTICVAALVTVCVILGSFILLHIGHSARRDEYSICRTRPCTLYATLLNRSIDMDQDPCNNFYSYVCNGWDRKEQESVYWTHLIAYSTLLADNLYIRVHPHNQSAVEKAIKFYLSCRRASAGNPGEIEEFRKLWEHCGIYWPKATENANLFKTLVLLYDTFQQENILNFRAPRFEDDSLYIFLGDQLLGLYRISAHIKNASGYQDYYESIQRILKPRGTKESELLPYKELVEIESAIQNGLLFTQYNTTSFTTNLSQISELTPNIRANRWLEALTLLHLPENTSISIQNEGYIRAFDSIFRLISEKELHRYVGWVNIQQMAPFINRDLLLAASGVTSHPSEFALGSCLYRTEVFMGWAMYANTAAVTFTPVAIEDLHSSIKNIADATMEQVKLPWLPLKRALIKSELKKWRFDLMKYPDRSPTSLDAIFANMSDMGDSLMENWNEAVKGLAGTNQTALALNRAPFVLQVIKNRYFDLYNEAEGTYRLPPTAAVMPLYEYGISEAVKYGGLGLLLAQGALAIVRYHANVTSGCFEKSLEGSLWKDKNIRNRAISLSIAWVAFSRRSSGEVRLQFLRTLTDKQMFFVATCYLLCGQQERKYYVRMCNEPLKHNSKFAEAFQCSDDSPMNQGKKCELLTT
ncbi:endothelin-converting enzyme 2-like [Ornithodoros turicata]|uniref:endothelin-converting enzyme 2-like n=1 Tax=Ornithodoros turicata TaxID=34597 RepID=UPI003138D8A7